MPSIDQLSRRFSERVLYKLEGQIALAAQHDVTILLTGPHGAGKSSVARLIHEHSPRGNGPFVVVACHAGPADTLESHLFGYVEKPSPGIEVVRAGKFAAAEEGTLVLDDIDALSLDLQAKVLRVIATGEYEPAGSKETHHCLARIITSSSQDLEVAMEAGKFRQDLYHRLGVAHIRLEWLPESREALERLLRALELCGPRLREDVAGRGEKGGGSRFST